MSKRIANTQEVKVLNLSHGAKKLGLCRVL